MVVCACVFVLQIFFVVRRRCFQTRTAHIVKLLIALSPLLPGFLTCSWKRVGMGWKRIENRVRWSRNLFFRKTSFLLLIANVNDKLYSFLFSLTNGNNKFEIIKKMLLNCVFSQVSN